MIKKELIEKYNGEEIACHKGDFIFEEGSTPKYYYQIINGGVKMSYYNQNGNEFIQGIFGKNRSFGEPPLLADLKYPANAIAISTLSLYRVTKSNFKKLLYEDSEEHLAFTKMLSKRLYFKATMANGITSNSAQEAILSLLNYIKNDVYNCDTPLTSKIELTRKEIAGLTGLSIESTIRTIKKMEKESLLKIVDRDVYY